MRKGYRLSEEHKRKISRALIGNKYGVANKGKKFSDEHKRKIGKANSIALKGRKLSEEIKLKISQSNKGKKRSEEIKLKISQANKNRRNWKLSEECKLRLSQINKDRWAKLSKEERRQRNKAWFLAARKSPSSLELKLGQLLDSLQIEYEIQKCIGNFVVDIFIPSEDLIIECDGGYWHNLPGRKESDLKRDTYLINLGFKIIRFNDSEIKKDFANVKLELVEKLGRN